MIAMRHGQPCLVHAVGGLKDTVADGHNGFAFRGKSLRAQVDNFVRTASKAIAIKENKPAKWRRICATAAATRFRWQDSAAQYIAKLYRAD
jgi:starch synthase